MPIRRPRRSFYLPDDTSESEANVSTRTTRRTRSAATQIQAPVLTDELRRSPRIVLKMPVGKLREATGSRAGRSVNVFQENPIISGPRSSRTKKKLVEIQTSEDEDVEDQEEDEVDDEDADADEDIEMDDAPLEPLQKRVSKVAVSSRGKAIKSAEKELDLEDDEEEGDEDEENDEDHLSDSDSDAEGEPDDLDESILPEANVDELEEEDDDMDEDMESDLNAMGSGKTTKRQRGNLGNDFLQLPMEPQVKKHLTAEERAMRRAEMARRRKNLSEKRNEEEKMDTINRLLKRQPPKKRGRQAAANTEGAESTPADQEPEAVKADPTMVRWVSNANGSTLNVPSEWLGTPAGRLFGAGGNGKMVEEV